MGLSDRLSEAREISRYDQDDVAAAVGVSRAMVSYWESAKRRPNDRQLTALIRLYRVDPLALTGDLPLVPRSDEAQMMFRRAASAVAPTAQAGLAEFVDFLDAYGRLAEAADFELHGMKQSPFGFVPGFQAAEDARRKAEEVREYLRLGLGPITDLDAVCELMGITVFRAALGDDLAQSPSGAFLAHPGIGFAILANLEMTPGRRRFSIAHELAHALFHSDKERYVLSGPNLTPGERFANLFAGEFLMPTEGIRRVLEEVGNGPRVADPQEVVHLQRFFNVSYTTALVRLRQTRLISPKDFDAFKSIRPVVFAIELGYEVSEEEFEPNVEAWRIRRFPPRFLRLLRISIDRDVASVPSLASLTRLTVDEIEEFLLNEPRDAEHQHAEFDEYDKSGILD